jgi:hypothetical protein
VLSPFSCGCRGGTGAAAPTTADNLEKGMALRKDDGKNEKIDLQIFEIWHFSHSFYCTPKNAYSNV